MAVLDDSAVAVIRDVLKQVERVVVVCEKGADTLRPFGLNTYELMVQMKRAGERLKGEAERVTYYIDEDKAESNKKGGGQ